MKRLLAASALSVIALASQANAADLAARPVYTKAPEFVPVVNNWSGWYIGGNVGYGWGDNNTDFTFLPAPSDFGLPNNTVKSNTSGVIGGGQVGYNWQIGTFLVGLEADIQGSGVKGSSVLSPVPSLPGIDATGSSLSSNNQLSWFGTFRGRLGFTVTPSLLLYGTGGLAYGEVQNSANTTLTGANSFPVSISGTRTGWAAGAGAEWMFAPSWSAKVEYLHIDLGNASAIGTNVNVPPADVVQYNFHNQYDTVRVGVNYHFH